MLVEYAGRYVCDVAYRLPGQHGTGVGAPATGSVRCSTAVAGSFVTWTKRRAILWAKPCIRSSLCAGTCRCTTASGRGTRCTGEGVAGCPDTGEPLLAVIP